MFNEFFSTHRDQFMAIAEIFLRVGATSVRLMDDETIIFAYPENTALAGTCVIAKKAGLTLQICGLNGEPWESVAEALVEQFVELTGAESQLESLTAALVETQDRLVAIYDLSNATRRTFEIPDLLDLLIREACRLLDVNGAFAILSQPMHRSIIRQVGKHQLPETQIFAAATFYLRHPQTNRDASWSSKTIPAIIPKIRMITIPVREGVAAGLGLHNETGKFNSPDIKLIKALAQQIGAQLENALLIQEALAKTRLSTEMNLARQVQMGLLPQKLPAIPGLDVYATSHPALEVGGDFFDVVDASGKAFAFLLGDVTGKGMPAALLMSMTHTVARSAALHMPFTAPHQLMERLNIDLQDGFSTVGMFSTIFIATFKPHTRQISYCNAGQSPIYHMTASGQATLLEAQDIPVGIFDGYQYTSQVLEINPGDVLIAASDGFPEARNPTEELFGYQRMEEVLLKHRHRTAEEIAHALTESVSTFSKGQPQDDDRTIIVLKVM